MRLVAYLRSCGALPPDKSSATGAEVADGDGGGRTADADEDERVMACVGSGCAERSEETQWYGKRGLLIWQNKPIDGKRGLWQKGPAEMAKETCRYGKRGLSIRQNRPLDMAKEAY